jgi:hypothetical protein
MNWGLIYSLLLVVFFIGCIETELQAGSPGGYELPGLNNTTIFYLNGSTVQVVDNVVNETSVSFILEEPGDMNFRAPVAVDYSGKNVTFNTSREPIFGKTYVKFDFGTRFSGFIAYTQSDGQDFVRTLTKNGSVRVVLPVNFTTGSRFFGIASPKPDNITLDASGREVLIWEAPYPVHEKIEVKYYHRNAPEALLYFFAILFAGFVVVYSYYYLSLRALRKKRELMEKGIKK